MLTPQMVHKNWDPQGQAGVALGSTRHRLTRHIPRITPSNAWVLIIDENTMTSHSNGRGRGVSKTARVFTGSPSLNDGYLFYMCLWVWRVYICVCECLRNSRDCKCACICAWAYWGLRLMLGVFLCCTSAYSLRQGLSTEPKAQKNSQWDGQFA